MNDKALKTLEYDKIITMLAAKAVSAAGKEFCFALKPSDDLNWIRSAQSETSEALAFVYKKGSLPLGGIKDVRESVQRAGAGGVLSILELMNVGEFLRVSRKVVGYAQNDNPKNAPLSEAFPILAELFGFITTSNFLEGEINRCVVNENTIADDASPKLKNIRRDISVANGRVREHLNAVIRSQANKGILQDAVITMRNGRFCVPVKAEQRANFDGLIHDQSSSGSTLFVEPMAVVTMNNKIKELESQERDEVERVLRELSALVANAEGTLKANMKALTELDFIFAKAELSLSMRGTEPVFNMNRRINIKKARHPLLNSDAVVPTDVWLGKEFNILLITGPNTGGKTVSLKTIGLFTLMGQAGLHIPALDNSELGVFTEVFADVGDEQSIEQSLSTFSGHMTNIVGILGGVTEYSLVLLDELGAGTDPTEGAALAVSIIDFLRRKGAVAAVTTHYSELKLYALSTEGAENAACEFDVETMRPTYKLLIGVPGKSNAFAISRRLGLPEHIISAAKDTLSREDSRFEDVITDLEIARKSAAAEQDRAEQYRREAEALKRDFERQKAGLDKQRENFLREAKSEAARIYETARKEADAIVKETRKLADSAASSVNSMRELDDMRKKAKDKADEARASLVSDDDKPVIAPITRALTEGDRVFVHALNRAGVILTVPDGAGNVSVQAGVMKMKANIKDLSLDESAPKRDTTQNIMPVAKARSISPTIDLRGKLVDEALDELDKYLDDAYLAGLGRVDIIHGKGTGALRSAVTDFLKRYPRKKSFRQGEFGEGDSGVTVVELK